MPKGHPSIPGRHWPLDLDEVLQCRCGVEKRGDEVGPRGGRAWCWKMPDNTKYHSYECAKAYEVRESIEDSSLGAWEAEQAAKSAGYDDAA